MTFVTEKISEQDIEKYGLLANGKPMSPLESFEWTIDRNRDIYLRQISIDWHEPRNVYYDFYWKGASRSFWVRCLSFEGQHGGRLHTVYDLLTLPRGSPAELPPKLEVQREQVMEDLKEALIAKGTAESVPIFSEYVAEFKF